MRITEKIRRVVFVGVFLVAGRAPACGRSQNLIDCGVCTQMEIRGQKELQPARMVVMEDGTRVFNFYPSLGACQEDVNACQGYFKNR